MTGHQKSSNSASTMKTAANLRGDPILGYKLKILLFDLRNVQNPDSERRILATTDELYISGPYFTVEEAACVKKATACDDESTTSHEDQTVEDAIQARLINFFEARKASGDMRPCGPHDMSPVYESVFGITLAELNNERFQSRLRRQGLSTLASVSAKPHDNDKKAQGRNSGKNAKGSSEKGRKVR
ncbi:hypothetical protein F4677DRAFT_441315 [Hypoxylon crocopeplum]|nr:hypothetical protein F4677DRAFT_441315 [Hypoxylon crocopeplum]